MIVGNLLYKASSPDSIKLFKANIIFFFYKGHNSSRILFPSEVMGIPKRIPRYIRKKFDKKEWSSWCELHCMVLFSGLIRIKWVCRIFIFYLFPASGWLHYLVHVIIFQYPLINVHAKVCSGGGKEYIKWAYGHYTGDVHLSIITIHISFYYFFTFWYQNKIFKIQFSDIPSSK